MVFRLVNILFTSFFVSYAILYSHPYVCATCIVLCVDDRVYPSYIKISDSAYNAALPRNMVRAPAYVQYSTPPRLDA